MTYTIKEAVIDLILEKHAGVGYYIQGRCEEDLSEVKLLNGSNLSFTYEDAIVRRKKLDNDEPMKILREERNCKLAETDWMSFSDSPTMTDAWRTYRQTLRDLPSNAEPQLDENGQLTNVTWPTKPE
tara:strand:- start:20 stop:400 length:381 start_codon:yes stop_codon:yes gene_type:complete